MIAQVQIYNMQRSMRRESLFDFLGDNCDDTVECYQTATYEFLEVSNDTLHLILSDESDVNEGIIFLDSDSTIIISYNRGKRT